MRALNQGGDPEKIHLREIMARPMLSLDHMTLLDEAYRVLLAGHGAIIVTKQGRLNGIITRTDLMNYYQLTPRSAKKDIE